MMKDQRREEEKKKKKEEDGIGREEPTSEILMPKDSQEVVSERVGTQKKDS
jgi:hypothetical protein